MSFNYRIMVVITAVLMTAAAYAGDWPQFRGPNQNQLPESKQLPQEWGRDKNLAWQAEIPGEGWASPIIAGSKVFVSTAVLDEATVKTANESGRRRSRPDDAVYSWQLHCFE